MAFLPMRFHAVNLYITENSVDFLNSQYWLLNTQALPKDYIQAVLPVDIPQLSELSRSLIFILSNLLVDYNQPEHGYLR